MFYIHDLLINVCFQDKDKLQKIADSLNIQLTVRDMRHTDSKVQLQALCGQWLPLAKTLLGKVVGFEVHTAVVMKSTIFWDITLCTSLKVNWYFRGTCDLLLGLFFDPEDGGDMFLQNVSCLLVDYTASYPRR
jgi:hypothetical protein